MGEEDGANGNGAQTLDVRAERLLQDEGVLRGT
jgi:hypothetical protein